MGVVGSKGAAVAVSVHTRKLARQAGLLPAEAMSEAQYQAWIEVEGEVRGFTRRFHVRRSRVKGQWVTNTSEPGVPDLWLLKPGRLVVLEVKSESGVASEAQNGFISWLQTVQGVDAFVVRPSDSDLVLHVLDGHC